MLEAIAFLCLAVAIAGAVSIGYAFYRLIWKDDDDAFKFFVSGIGAITLALFVFIPTAIVHDNRIIDRERAACAAAGGELQVQYRSSDLCIGEDGRFIIGWSRNL